MIIIDTAGRLHNKKNLMDELNKISRVIERELPGASKEVLLVLDATTGQNAVNQAKDFKDAAGITGIVLTKLDGTARGGVVLAINNELDVPVKFVGVGEQIDDLQPLTQTPLPPGCLTSTHRGGRGGNRLLYRQRRSGSGRKSGERVAKLKWNLS